MQLLYNGIRLPDTWPPRYDLAHDPRPQTPPYLANPPAVIDARVGRQLFIDDFLVRESDMDTVWHSAKKLPGNPIFKAETPLELETLPGAAPKSGGVWYDKKRGKYRMWYEAGWLNSLAYAESDDGLSWSRPAIASDGTNRLFKGFTTDSTAVFIDPDDVPERRYKAFMREPGGLLPGYIASSSDGITWSELSPTTPVYDRSTAFYDPFRKKYVYSIRSDFAGRSRSYRECADFAKGAKWSPAEEFEWLRTDSLDLPDPETGMTPQLYNFDAVAYESVMLGLFEIHLGPENGRCETDGFPKLTELQLAFSRDGFHYSRPCRKPFIPASRAPGSWDRGYVQSVGGVCVIHGDELWFYYIGFSGDRSHSLGNDWKLNGMYSGGATGIATLRRDGFASKRGPGSLTTRPMLLDGSFLWVNAACSSLRAEVLDTEGRPLPNFTLNDCTPLTGDSTRAKVGLKGDLHLLAGKPVSLRFTLGDGDLYSFWASDDGESGGYDAAGAR